MKWWAARLLYESVHDPPDPGETVYEERIILVRADNELDGATRAAALGRRNQESYRNVFKQRVTWELRELLDVREVLADDIVEGTEVYYGFLNAKALEHVRSSLSFKFADD